MSDGASPAPDEERLHLASTPESTPAAGAPAVPPESGSGGGPASTPAALVRANRPVGALTCVIHGARRVVRAPAVLIGVWLVNLALAVPLALAIRGALESHFGPSLVAAEAAQGFSLGWWGEYAGRVEGLAATTFSASVIGFAAVLRNLSDLADGHRPMALLCGVIGLWLIAWTFLWGGILDRYARNRPTRAGGFFAACGAHAGRLLRLGMMAGLAYVVLFRYVHPLLLDQIFDSLTRDLAVERTTFLIRLMLYALFAVLLAAVHIVTDVARVRAVIENRRSMLGAYFAAWRLLMARPLAVLGIYALTGVVLVCWLLLYALVAPGSRTTGIWIWLAFIAGQLYLAGRLWLKLQVPAALIALYRAEVARGELDLMPPPVWPETPPAAPAED